MPGVSKTKAPRSTCIAWSVWESTASYKRGERPNDKSVGQMTYKFRKTPTIYQCSRRRITLGLWSSWLARKLGSVGKVYNARIRGVY